jgi:Domain of unknown function (DUF4412)
MPSRFPLLPLLALLLACFPAGADSMLTLKSHADAFLVAGEAQAPKDIQVRLWVAGDKVRRDEGDTSMILRLDRNKLFILHHAEKTYNEVALPVDFLRLMPKGKEQLGTLWAEKMKLTVQVTPAAETRKVNGWTARRTEMDIASAMGMKVSTTLWLSKDIADYPVLNKLTAALAALQPGAADWSRKLAQMDGFPVLKEDEVDFTGNHFKTREELVSVETKTAPASFWDPPAGYQAEAFDPFPDS